MFQIPQGATAPNHRNLFEVVLGRRRTGGPFHVHASQGSSPAFPPLASPQITFTTKSRCDTCGTLPNWQLDSRALIHARLERIDAAGMPKIPAMCNGINVMLNPRQTARSAICRWSRWSWCRWLLEPVVDTSKESKHQAANQGEVEVGDHKVGMVQLPVERRGGQHNAVSPAT